MGAPKPVQFLSGVRAKRGGAGGPEGFTLIELLVVIAIIALLVSMLMPSLRQAKELGKQAVCASHLQHVGAAMNMYVPDNNDYMPGYEDEGSQYDPVGYTDPDGKRYYRWRRGVLYSYWCADYSRPPRNSDGILSRYTSGRSGGIQAILSCPAVKRGPTKMRLTHYWNYFYDAAWGEKTYGLNYRGVCDWDGVGRFMEAPVRKIDRPFQLMYMCDGMGVEPCIYQSFYDFPYASSAYTPTPRHFDQFQLVFCDAHVECGPLDQYYRREYLYNPNTIGK